MTSCDTNILLHAYNSDSPLHQDAKEFLRFYAGNDEFAVCELVLIELYVLLRNPAVVAKPLAAQKAVNVCKRYRQNRRWVVVDYPGNLMGQVWRYASRPEFGRRAVFDARLALTLRHHGVEEFATVNEKHFGGYGFSRVWNPLQ